MTATNRTSTVTIALIVLGAIVVLSLFTMGGGMMGYGGVGMFGGGMLLWPLLLVGFVLLLVYGVDSRGRTDDASGAVTTLRERYARGELTDEEFEQRRQTLEGQPKN